MSRKKGVLYSYVLMGVETLSSILFTPFLIRCLGQEEWGIYGLIASLTAYLYLLDLGVGNAIVKYMSKYHANKELAREKNMLAVSLSFYFLIGIIILLIGFVLKSHIPSLFNVGLTVEQQGLAQKLLLFTVLTAIATLVFAPMNKTIIAYEKFAVSKGIDIFKVFVRVGLCVIALVAGGKAYSIVIMNFVATVVCGLVSTWYVTFYLKLSPSFHDIPHGFVIEIFSYSSFILMQMLATQIINMINPILIGAFVASSAAILGIYMVGNQIVTYYQSLGTSITGVLMPGVVRLVESKGDNNALMGEMVKDSRFILMFLGIILVVFSLVGRQFIEIWAGKVNSDGYIVALIIMIPQLFSLTQQVQTQVLWALDKHKLQSIIKLVLAIVSIFVSIVLIKKYSIIGAAFGTALVYFFGDVLLPSLIVHKELGLSALEYYRKTCSGIIPALLISGIVGALLLFLPVPGFVKLILVSIVSSFVYYLLLKKFALTQTERDFFRSIPVINKLF